MARYKAVRVPQDRGARMTIYKDGIDVLYFDMIYGMFIPPTDSVEFERENLKSIGDNFKLTDWEIDKIDIFLT